VLVVDESVPVAAVPVLCTSCRCVPRHTPPPNRHKRTTCTSVGLPLRDSCASVLSFTVVTGGTPVCLGIVVGSADLTGAGVVAGGGGLVTDGVRLLGVDVVRCDRSLRWMSAVRSAQR